MNKRQYCCLITHVLLCASSVYADSHSAREIIQATGVSGGLVVHVGCGDGKLTAELRASDSYIVQGLDTDSGNVEKARRHIRSLGLSGSVSVDVFAGDRLPYIDNLVNLIVMRDARHEIRDEELKRVLAPGGKIIALEATRIPHPVSRIGNGFAMFTKPVPSGIDEWTHYLHGPDNNAVADDSVVGPPRQVQWLAGPRWTRSHHKLASISSIVTAEGRLFYIIDEATAANINVPSKWSIVARDAFSGVKLWTKPMESWAWHTIRFRSGPPQVTRLLVVSGDRLYAPLGLNSPISVIDAVTGKTLKTFGNTEGAEEIILVDGLLLVLRGSPVAEHAAGHAAFKQRYRIPNTKTIMAVDAETGEKIWEWSDPDVNPKPETLGADGGKVFLQVGEGVVCLDLKSGKELWTYGERGKKDGRKGVSFGNNTLVATDGVVLCKLSGQLTALSAENGKKLWECKAGGGFHAPLDIFVIDGLVWQGLHVSDSVSPPPVLDFNVGRDLHTGEIKERNAVAVDLQTSGHHHRCYREKATDRYIITGKRGIEMMDLAGDNHSRNNWVRGACQYGILPANGLMYAPPHACGCYMESKLWGFWALAAEESRAERREARVEGLESRAGEETLLKHRFERGPAYGELERSDPQPTDSSLQPSAAWPMFRHDPLRSGIASTMVPTKLKQAWKADIGGRLTQPVIAGGKVVLSSIDENTVYALNAADGKVIWRFVAGGRVDSPPTIHNGTVLFGSADGRVYCLRLSDGELAWRFLAAPADLRVVALDQVESVWPVHGSVLVLDGVAYCSAGRSTWLDGGIELYGLDPAKGDVVYHNHFESRHPKLFEGKDEAKPEHETRVDQNTTDYKTFLASDRSDAFSMAEGAVSDVLVSDGKNVFLHHVRFNAKLEKQDRLTRHLFSTSGFLDDTENHRSHWVMGTGDFSRVPVAYSWIANRPGGGRRPTIAVPAGVMMVYDENAIWGVRRQGDSNGKYSLFKKENTPFSDNDESLPDFRSIPKDQADKSVWKINLPVRTKAMLKSADNLFLAVMPVAIPADDPHAAYEGRMGGMIWVASCEDGSKIAEYQLDSPAVWDGMAAAGGKLFLSSCDGTVQCLAGSVADGPSSQ